MAWNVRVRNLAVDAGFLSISALLGLAGVWDEVHEGVGALVVADLVAGVVACLALTVRRRWPVAVALLTVGLSAFSLGAGGAASAATFSVAIRRPWPVVGWIGLLGVVTLIVNEWIHPPEVPWLASTVTGVLGTALAIGCGRLVRARRQLVYELTERARRAEDDQQARLEEARRQERMRLAHEMHDVLAHRMSLLSVHAGALEFSPNASPEEIARAAGVIRSGAHQMLVDLRAIIGLLRDGVDDETAPPQPTLTELGDLVEESRETGARVRFSFQIEDPEEAPTMTARTVYRIVQEGLTNARKHAPGETVTVTLRGKPGEGVTVEVRQPLGAGAGSVIPGAGLGMVGLAERTTLAGGRLDHGPTGAGDYRLWAWLPWEEA